MASISEEFALFIGAFLIKFYLLFGQKKKTKKKTNIINIK